MRKKILLIFGTRPEAIKLAPVVRALEADRRSFDPVVCVTAQHRSMLDQVLDLFRIRPDIDLDLMVENQTLDGLTSRALKVLTKTLEKVRPDVVVVQGDTTTAMAAALASYYRQIPVAHVEAGLRTYDIHNPFPEEVNRRIIAVAARYHFAPTRRAREALLREGARPDTVFQTGNTVVDALRAILRLTGPRQNSRFPARGRRILVTAHRRENFGRPLENICGALREIADRHEDVEIVYPVHLNPNVRGTVRKRLSGHRRIRLLPPVEYGELVRLLSGSYMVMTDSGGLQEEAPALGKPVLVLRKETERPEGIEARVARLVGVEKRDIVRAAESLLSDRRQYDRMARAVSPYGDGRAAERIAAILKK